jgi:4-amino-4-deoxy-L-arabinose transferase-like glycosyltransferase
MPIETDNRQRASALHRPRRAALAAWLLAAGVLLAARLAIGLTGETNPYKSPLRGLISAALTGGLIALAITGVVALLSRRQSAAVDVFRTACWCLIGSCLNVKANVPFASYFVPFHGFWPSYLDSIRTLSRLGVVAGLTAIVVATVLFRPPPLPKPGCCSRCGYNLTDNTSGICPECGTPVSGTAGKLPPNR